MNLRLPAIRPASEGIAAPRQSLCLMLEPIHLGNSLDRKPLCPKTTPAHPLPDTVLSSPPPPAYRPIKTLTVLLASALGMAALLAFVPAAGHDQLWFLLMAQRWLAGAQIYGPAIFDSNTPAVVWLSAIPVSLAPHLHLAVPATAKLLVALLELAVAALCLQILRRLVPTLTRAQILFLALAFVILYAVVPARDLGQRDHLTAVLCLPYLLAATLALDGPPRSSAPANGAFHPLDRLRYPAALLAAVGLCLKPQQTLVPLAVETAVLFLWSRRPAPRPPSPASARDRLRHALTRLQPLLRPEPRLLILCGTLFLVAMHQLTPLFFTRALPLLFDTYWAIGRLTPAQLFSEAPQLHLLALAAVTLAIGNRRQGANSRRTSPQQAVTLLLVAGSAATAAYYLQGTGWYYQQLPAITLFGAALALELLTFADLHQIPQLPAYTLPAIAALGTLALALTFHFSGYPFTRHPFTDDRTCAISTPDPSFFAALPPGTPVATLTTSVDDAIMPIVRYHLTWAQRTNNLWLLPATLRNTRPAADTHPIPAAHRLTPAHLAALSAIERRWMVEDLTRWHPALVLVENCERPEVNCQVLAEHGERRHDDLLAFFLADPAFAQLWQQHYRLLRSSGPYTAYRLSTPF